MKVKNRLWRVAFGCASAAWLGQPVRGELIFIEPMTSVVQQGEAFSVLVKLTDNTTPLFGYSLDIDIIGQPGSIGMVTVNIGATNFFDLQNLIIAGGAVLDPIFSLIIDPGDGGVFISANTDDGSTVIAVDGVNDVLAQIVFTAPQNALGDFTIDLGSASALSDADGFAVPFVFTPGTITVIPAPAAWLVAALGAALIGTRRRRR